jgi:hypothetical protein
MQAYCASEPSSFRLGPGCGRIPCHRLLIQTLTQQSCSAYSAWPNEKGVAERLTSAE